MTDTPEIWLHIALDTVTLKGRNTKVNFIIFQFCKKHLFVWVTENCGLCQQKCWKQIFTQLCHNLIFSHLNI